MKWEYKTLRLSLYNETVLNILGEDGWELAGMAQNEGNDTFYCIFKRLIQTQVL